jgi:cytochrome c biogenesis protein CcmG, thiol:disulfide interchange protein DsbE
LIGFLRRDCRELIFALQLFYPHNNVMIGSRITHWLLITALAATVAGSDLEAAKPKSVGSKAPAFSVTLLDGSKKSLADYRGKVLVLNYWATWCAPCKAEMPMMSRYHRLNKARGFEIIGIVTRDNVAEYQLERVSKALSYPLSKVFQGKYGLITGTLPTNYIIDRKGVIRYAQAGSFEAADFKEIIDPLLAE